MEIKITAKLKKLISTLVCVMMVFGTFPVHMLNASVFAEDAVVYGAQTAAVPEIAEDVEGENAQSDELSEKQDEQAAEAGKEAEDVLMEGGDGEGLSAASIDELRNAIENAKSEDTIVLTDDINVTTQDGYALNVKDKKITITSDTGNRKIICKGEGSLLKVEGEASGVTLEKVEIDGCDIARDKSLMEVDGGSLTLDAGAKVHNCKCIVRNREYEETCCGGAICCCKNGIVNVKQESEISKCEASEDGGAIYCLGGEAKIAGGEISDCSARGGGAIYCESGEVKIIGGEIFDCNAEYAGAVYCGDQCRVNMNGGKISKCEASEDGGAIYGLGGEAKIAGGEISDCRAKNGGAMYFDGNGTVSVENGGKISKCEASGDGGAIYCLGGEVKIAGGEISDCSAKNGGAIRCRYGEVDINLGKIFECEASEDGGAIYCLGGEVKIIGGEIFDCNAEYGGAVYCGDQCRVNMNGGEISKCEASEDGGAVYFGGQCRVNINGGKISKCEASEDGGAICAVGESELSLISKGKGKLTIEQDKYSKGKNTDPTKTGGYEGIYLGTGVTFNIIGEFKVETFLQLKVAIDNAQSGDTIKIVNDIDINNSDDIDINNSDDIDINNSDDSDDIDDFALTVKDKKITITSYTERRKITCKDRGSLLKIEGKDAGVILENIEIDGELEGNINNAKVDKDLICVMKGSLVLGEGAKISNYSSRSKVIYCSYGTINMNKGEIFNCGTTTCGGAIYCEFATVNMNGGKISNCEVYDKGGAIYCYGVGGTVNISGGEISNCKAYNGAGAICCDEGTVNISGGKISNCKADDYGGAICCFNRGDVYISGGEISSCYATKKGNVIYVTGGIRLSLIDAKSGKLTIKKAENALGEDSDPKITGGYEGIYLSEGSTILNIISSENDAGVKVETFEQLKDAIDKAKNGDIIKLAADIDVINQGGYALTVKDKKITITSDQYIRRILCKNPGSLLKIEDENSSVILQHVAIDGCNVKRTESLIDVSMGSLVLGKWAEISKCSQTGFGGAIGCGYMGKVDIDGGTISECEALHGGAAICCGGDGTVCFDNGGKIFNCRSEGKGGAIHCMGGTVKINRGAIFDCVANSCGGAIYCSGIDGTINMNGGGIFNCQAGACGGAIYCDKMVEVDVTGVIRDCVANDCGGAIFAESGSTVNICEGKILDCYASLRGNVIYVTDGARLSLIDDRWKLRMSKAENAKGEDTDVNKTRGYEGIYLAEDATLRFISSNNNNVDGKNTAGGNGENNNNAGSGNNNAGDVNIPDPFIPGDGSNILSPFYVDKNRNGNMPNLFYLGYENYDGYSSGKGHYHEIGAYGGNGGGNDNDIQIEDAENYGDENEYDEGEYDEDYDDEYDEDKEDGGYAAENGSGSGKSSKNDFWGAMLPWLIGAAVVVICAAAVVVVLKNRRRA